MPASSRCGYAPPPRFIHARRWQRHSGGSKPCAEPTAHPKGALHSAKCFLDGVLENRTAAMLADYSDAAGGNAAIMFDLDHLRDLFVAFDAARFQLHVHVIGDRAARVAFDCI